MPQPTQIKSASSQSRGMLERPECAILIAAIAAEWSYVENRLIEIFASVLGNHTVSEDGMGIAQNYVAALSLESAETIRTRLKMMDSVLSVIILDDDLKNEWNNLKTELYKKSRARNKTIHETWYFSAELGQDLLSYDNKTGIFTKHTPHDLNNTLNSIVECREKCWTFMELLLEGQRNGKVSYHRTGA